MVTHRTTLSCLILVLGVTFHASREAVAQMQGTPGAPQQSLRRSGGMNGMNAAAAKPPAPGSSVPMMGRQQGGRSGSVAPSVSGNRYSRVFNSDGYRSMGTAAGAAQGGVGIRNSSGMKAQTQAAGVGPFGIR